MCKVLGCERKSFATGLCRSHYRFSREGKPLSTPIARKYGSRVPDVECSVPNCTRWANGTGFCRTCSSKWRRSGGPIAPLREPQLITIDSSGYARVNVSHPLYDGRSQAYEHVRVMESSLGRRLLSCENVHHKNGVRNDNRPENLELWSSSQPPGQRVEDKVQWARQIIAQYGDLIS